MAAKAKPTRKAKPARRERRVVGTGPSSAPKVAKRTKRPPKPAPAAASKPALRAKPVAAKRGRPRRPVAAGNSGLARIVIDHLTRLVADIVQEQRRMVAAELEALLG